MQTSGRGLIDQTPLGGGAGSLPAQLYWELFDVEGDGALGCDTGRFDDRIWIGGGVAGLFLLGDGIQPVGRGDQGGSVWCHEAAQDGAAGLHQLGSEHYVDFALRRHQR